MLLTIELTQVNKAGNKSFAAKATLNTGNDLGLQSTCENIAKFCKAVDTLQKKNAKLGYKTNTSFKKSLPLNLTIEGTDINTISLEMNTD